MDPIIVYLTPDELDKCKKFSEESAKTQQRIEFGQDDTMPRSVKEIARDNLIGKMAEVALKKFLYDRYRIETAVDFNVYARGVWDNNDLVINDWQIDIKSTRSGHWFLIEWSKLSFRQRQKKLPNAFFMCRTPWNRDNDIPKGMVEICGALSLKGLCSGSPMIRTLRKGDLIPGTTTHLQADNYGIKFNNLNHDWDNIIYTMLTSKPVNPDMIVNFPFEFE